MHKIHLYLAKKIGTYSLIVLFVMTLLLFLSQSIRSLDLITNKGITVSTVMYITYLYFLSVWTQALPFSLLIGLIFTWNNLNNNQELIIIQAVGTSPIKIFGSGIIIGILVTIISFFLSFELVPNSNYEYKQFKENIYQNYNINALESGKFIQISDTTTFYVKNITGNKLVSILIYSKNYQNNGDIFIYAENGYIDFDKKKIVFLLNSVNIQEISNKGSITFLQLDKYIFDFSGKSSNEIIRNDPKMYNIRNLLNNNLEIIKASFSTSIDNQTKEMAKIQKELIKRLNIILFPLFISIITSYFFTIKKFSRTGSIKPIIYTLLLSISFKILTLLSESTENIWLLLMPAIILLICISYMLYKIIRPPRLTA